jgi:2-iminobutanoate/2-iminopropanoate deaminase
MQKKIASAAVVPPRGFYSQAVQAGPMLFIAGQLPLDISGQIVGQTAAEQARQALSNVRHVLQAANADWHNLVQVTVYISDIAHWPAVNQVYQEMLAGVPVPPARAVVPVKEMHYGALVEVQATAYLPE